MKKSGREGERKEEGQEKIIAALGSGSELRCQYLFLKIENLAIG